MIFLKEVKIIKENSRQKITLCEENGKFYLKREIEGDKREVYKRLQKINHPNIPKVFSVGMGDKTVIIEEYVHATSLAILMEKGYVFKPHEIKSIVNKLLNAMEAIHSLCIIHKDIKPENILMDTEGNVWLIDFDIARIFRGDLRRDTEQMGSFGYAPIEQYGMIPTDMKTDIYSFGVTLKKLLDYAGIKGSLYKIAEKCKKLDPSDRFETVGHIKRKITHYKLLPWVIGALGGFVALLVLAVSVLLPFVRHIETESIPPGYVEVSEEEMELLRFYYTELPAIEREYATYENFNSVSIFNDEEMRHHLHLLTDEKFECDISLGKNRKTFVNANFELKDGVLSVHLEDEAGHQLNHTFLPGEDEYSVIYPENRRVIANAICHDTNGDGVEELLIGLADCSFNVKDNALYPYFNACWGWIVRYDEARGFVLCEGEMFAENHKFVVYNDRGNVFLSLACLRPDGRIGYELRGDTINPIY